MLSLKAQLSPLQSGMMIGADGLRVSFIPTEIDGELAAELYRLQGKAFSMTVIDSMGNISFNASIPDTQSAIKINPKRPQLQVEIPKQDLLMALRLVALFGLVFEIQIANGAKAEPKAKKEKKIKLGTDENGFYWSAMRLLEWWYAPGIAEVLECEKTEESATKALKILFEVSSRREISPDVFDAWCKRHLIESAITVSQQARVKGTSLMQESADRKAKKQEAHA